MGNIDLGKAFTDAWEVFSKNLVTFIVATLLLMIISFFSLFLLYGVMAGGLFLMVKKGFEGGQAEIGEVFSGFSRFGGLFVGFLFSGVVLLIGALFCGIGALFTAPLVVFLFPLIINGFTVGEAVSKSWEGYKKNFVGWLVVSLVTMFLASAGNFIAIGWLVTIPFSFCVIYAAYLQAFAEPAIPAAAVPVAEPVAPPVAPPVAEPAPEPEPETAPEPIEPE